MKSFIKKVWHAIRMRVSKEYTRNFQVNEVLASLRRLVYDCEHRPADLEAIQHMVETVRTIDPVRFDEAVSILATADNFKCMELAIGYDRRRGKPCADRLMNVARWHLKLYGHMDRATWARKRLLLAQEWYAIADAMTAQLREEIRAGLKNTEWILN